MSEKTLITVADIRKGDTIRCEYETVSGPAAHEYVADKDKEEWSVSAGYFLLSRPVPPVVLPTEPGAIITWNPNNTGGPLFAQLGNHPDGPWMHESRHMNDAEMINRIGGKAFTRLPNEAEVVTEVMGKLDALYGSSLFTSFRDDRESVAKEYGVTL
ncbi:hypothetical protein E3T46_07845 [Cryobacterium sp. Hh11]|uniref:hypothetical protein n=1 Tax=Cryobacterium sp. Hh11 TaxID=2555868 RepID=UPI00106C133F|nr:hypothetical protein [Cryobacterium sp. Hh11]TFD51992.1 hypothetical protein E3T46_07845 [Cryobacterium sp. Hh11]